MPLKTPFSLILCFFLLASLLFILNGTVDGRLWDDYYQEEDDNGKTKAGVRRSWARTAPSWIGHHSPPGSSGTVSSDARQKALDRAREEQQRALDQARDEQEQALEQASDEQQRALDQARAATCYAYYNSAACGVIS